MKRSLENRVPVMRRRTSSVKGVVYSSTSTTDSCETNKQSSGPSDSPEIQPSGVPSAGRPAKSTLRVSPRKHSLGLKRKQLATSPGKAKKPKSNSEPLFSDSQDENEASSSEPRSVTPDDSTLARQLSQSEVRVLVERISPESVDSHKRSATDTSAPQQLSGSSTSVVKSTPDDTSINATGRLDMLKLIMADESDASAIASPPRRQQVSMTNHAPVSPQVEREMVPTNGEEQTSTPSEAQITAEESTCVRINIFEKVTNGFQNGWDNNNVDTVKKSTALVEKISENLSQAKPNSAQNAEHSATKSTNPVQTATSVAQKTQESTLCRTDAQREDMNECSGNQSAASTVAVEKKPVQSNRDKEPPVSTPLTKRAKECNASNTGGLQASQLRIRGQSQGFSVASCPTLKEWVALEERRCTPDPLKLRHDYTLDWHQQSFPDTNKKVKVTFAVDDHVQMICDEDSDCKAASDWTLEMKLTLGPVRGQVDVGVGCTCTDVSSSFSQLSPNSTFSVSTARTTDTNVFVF